MSMWVELASVNQQWPWQYSGTNQCASPCNPPVSGRWRERGREGGRQARPWGGAGGYLLSSTDLALLTCSRSRSESTSRTCLCCTASSRRQSSTILDKLGEASF